MPVYYSNHNGCLWYVTIDSVWPCVEDVIITRDLRFSPFTCNLRTGSPAQPLTRWWPNHPYRSFPWKSSHWSICDDSCTSKLRGGRRGRRSSMAPSFDQDARKQAGQDSLLFHDDSLRSVSPPRSRILDPTTTPPSWILERRLGGIASWNSQQQLQKDLATLEAGSLGDFSPVKRSFPIDICVSTPREAL